MFLQFIFIYAEKALHPCGRTCATWRTLTVRMTALPIRFRGIYVTYCFSIH